jgi:hypothetical protein
MIRLCLTCKETKKSPYKNICYDCYQTKWRQSIPEKKCTKCLKSFKTPGELCYSCKRYKRIDKKEKKPCSGCGREGLLIIHIGLNLCTKCLRNKRDLEQEGYKDRRILSNRRFTRKYNGIPEDLWDAPPKDKSKGFWHCNGYVIMYKKDHPNSNSNDCIRQHVYVMSEHLGRPLQKGENVHHKNGIRDDNRIENLELWHVGQPAGQRVEEKIEWAKSFLESYGYIINGDNSITI